MPKKLLHLPNFHLICASSSLLFCKSIQEDKFMIRIKIFLTHLLLEANNLAVVNNLGAVNSPAVVNQFLLPFELLPQKQFQAADTCIHRKSLPQMTQMRYLLYITLLAEQQIKLKL